jgi:hypothetical protein
VELLELGAVTDADHGRLDEPEDADERDRGQDGVQQADREVDGGIHRDA